MYSRSTFDTLAIALGLKSDSQYNSPLQYQEKRKPPSDEKIKTYLRELNEWLRRMDYDSERQRVVGIGGKKKVEKFIEKEWHFKLFSPTFRDISEGKHLPNIKDITPVRFITNPYKIPDIGGSTGPLTKYLRSIPLNMGSCYPTAVAIASRFPEVNVVLGVYLTNGILNLNSKALSQLPESLRKIAYGVAYVRQEDDVAEQVIHLGGHGNAQWFKNSSGNLRLWYRDRMWALHAWNEYKGKHFDPLLFKVLKEYKNQPNWQSVTRKRFIHWNHYRQIQKVSLAHYKEHELRALQIGAVDWLMVDSKRSVQNWDPKLRSGFPSSIPSRRDWIRNLDPAPKP